MKAGSRNALPSKNCRDYALRFGALKSSEAKIIVGAAFNNVFDFLCPPLRLLVERASWFSDTEKAPSMIALYLQPQRFRVGVPERGSIYCSLDPR
ncbi:hypothetical protein Y032_0021g382 [Ancylostoma ceylanicum]|uniref:Uncharacterized protein n=1 Tax=Ancylostoma ceylanicum TaxID=53326 RepID=A0A016V1V1_9BILA|nr:hypothetical protein Y032_0021g382 [Ancylostoma ceylanicum]